MFTDLTSLNTNQVLSLHKKVPGKISPLLWTLKKFSSWNKKSRLNREFLNS